MMFTITVGVVAVAAFVIAIIGATLVIIGWRLCRRRRGSRWKPSFLSGGGADGTDLSDIIPSGATMEDFGALHGDDDDDEKV